VSCFCKGLLKIPPINIAASLHLSESARAAMALNEQLTLGLPGFPGPPFAFTLPRLSLSASAAANLAAYAHLQAQAMARLGIDLRLPLGLTALARLTATLNARLSVLANLNLNFGPWLQLALLNRITVSLTAAFNAALSLSASAALNIHLFPPSWGGLHLGTLSMMMNASAQIGVSANLAASFTAMVQAIARLNLSLPNVSLVCNLSAGFSAIAQLGTGLGINPLQIGFPAVQAMVAANFSAMVSLAARLGINLSVGIPNLLNIPSLVAAIHVSLTATLRAVLAFNFSAVASLNVAASASLGVGLAVTALAANMSAALGINIAASVPCPICDARAIMAAAGAVSAVA